MKKLLPIILILGFLLPVYSANAVLGLSKCEKVKKAIVAEEKIGKESWKYFDGLRSAHGGESKYSVIIAESLLEIYKSDKTVFTIAIKNPKCFSSSQNATIRRQLAYTNSDISAWKKFVAEKNWFTGWGLVYTTYQSLFSKQVIG